MLRYPVTLTEDSGTILATFLDLPEAATFGADREDALLRAIDAIETAIQGRIADREPLPQAGGRCGHRFPRSHGPAERNGKGEMSILP
jgi:predicted RNase H-like HicB family nuclease